MRLNVVLVGLGGERGGAYGESVARIAVLLRIDFGEEDFVLEACGVCVHVVGV